MSTHAAIRVTDSPHESGTPLAAQPRHRGGDRLGPPIDVGAIPDILTRARAAQQEWARRSFHERARYLDDLKHYLARHADRLARTIAQSTGKVRQEALASEVLSCVMACDWYARHTAAALAPETLPNGNVLFYNKRNTLVYEPFGVVAIISPWNYPFTIPFGEVIMGLMAGNAIVLKVAENVVHVGQIIEECMRAVQLPDGLFTHVVLPGKEFSSAVLRAGVNKIFFTGSVAVGKSLMRAAADTLTPLSLELGGNDAMIVCDDADMERAVNGACWGAFTNAGQTCAAVERVYVHHTLYDRFVSEAVRRTQSMRHGPEGETGSVDMGSLTTQKQLETVRRHVAQAVELGATIAAQSRPVGDVSKGFFHPATVLLGCTPSMAVMQEETFGPVLPIVSVADDAEAIRLANGTSLGLTSSVYSESAEHGQAVAAQLQSGVVTINDHLMTHSMPETPWGGYKESSLGRTHGTLGLREMCNVKCICEERLSSRYVPRNMFWYPYSAASYDTIQAVIALAANGIVQSGLGVIGTLRQVASIMRTPWVIDENKKETGDGNV